MADSKPTRTDRKDKVIKKENLERGQKSDTGGDHWDRRQSQYSKNAPPRESDPYKDFF